MAKQETLVVIPSVLVAVSQPKDTAYSALYELTGMAIIYVEDMKTARHHDDLEVLYNA